jgi:hypothetical protein
MSRHRRQRRREGRLLFYSAVPAEKARRNLPADVAALCEELACATCAAPVLVLARQYRPLRALLEKRGVAVVVVCHGCLEKACAARPVAVLELEDEAVAARLEQYEAGRN